MEVTNAMEGMCIFDLWEGNAEMQCTGHCKEEMVRILRREDKNA